jgi:hypothetical protein
MAKYLISFPSAAMDHIPREEFPEVSAAAHAVVREAKAAGVWVFGGGINEQVLPLMIAGDGSTSQETYPQTRNFDGGFSVLEVPTREEAIEWARKIAVSCRCKQELREFQFDPES